MFLGGTERGGRGSRLSIAASTQRFCLHVKFSTSSSVADGKREEKKGKVGVGDVEGRVQRRGGVKEGWMASVKGVRQYYSHVYSFRHAMFPRLVIGVAPWQSVIFITNGELRQRYNLQMQEKTFMETELLP